MSVKVTVVVLLALCAMASAKVMFTRRMAPPSWALAGEPVSTASVTFMLSLKQQNLDVLESKFWAVSTPGSAEYRNFMSIDEIASITRPLPEHREAVVQWLAAHGITEFKDYVDAVEVTTTVSTVEAMFSTRMHAFKHVSGKVVIRQFGALSVPAEVSQAVTMVTGLSEFPVPRPNPFKLKSNDANQASYAIVPETLQAFYKTPSSAAAVAGSSQGVIEFEGQSFKQHNLAAFATQVGVTIAPVPAANIIGKNDPSQPGTEAELDIQWIAATGLNVDNWFWLEGGDAWLYTFATHFFNTTNVPAVASISYGWNEEDQCEDGIGMQECQQLGVDSKGFVAAVNTQFQKIGLRGTSLFSASGDSGANGRTDPFCQDAVLHPDFPGSSPFVTSVGATQFNNVQTNLGSKAPVCTSGQYECASGGEEVAVSYDQANFASGGGFSNVAVQPAYQQTAVQAYLNSGVALPPSSYFNATSRGYPDIAAFGTSILIYESGIEAVGGTSASSPIVAGVAALLNNAAIAKTGKPLGFLNPLLYQIAQDNPACFNDIVKGDNKCTENGCSRSCKGFLAAKGWDPVTGLGSPQYDCLLNYVQNHL